MTSGSRRSKAIVRAASGLRAVIYTRVSQKNDRSIEEQLDECRRECERNGWIIVAEFDDPAMSSSRFRRIQDRPGYVKTMQLLRGGGADVMVCWADNRAQRNLDEYVALRALCVETGALWHYGGRTYDMSDPRDRRTTSSDAQRSEAYSEDLKEHVQRAMDRNVRDGKPHGRCPPGYVAVRDSRGKLLNWEQHPEQARILRQAARRLLNLESIRSVSRDLAPEWAASGGLKFAPRDLRRFMINPTLAGLRVHYGEIVRDGTWEPIIGVEDHNRLRALLDVPGRVSHRGTEPKWLLTWIARCGVCLEQNLPGVIDIAHSSNPDGSPRLSYACRDHQHVTRNVKRVDGHVVELLMRLAESPDVERELNAPQDSSVDVDAELGRINELNRDLENFARDAAKQRLSALAVRAFEDQIKADIEQIRQRIKAMAVNPVLSDFVGKGARQRWKSRTVAQRREIIRHSLQITILPVGAGRRRDLGVQVRPLFT